MSAGPVLNRRIAAAPARFPPMHRRSWTRCEFRSPCGRSRRAITAEGLIRRRHDGRHPARGRYTAKPVRVEPDARSCADRHRTEAARTRRAAWRTAAGRCCSAMFCISPGFGCHWQKTSWPTGTLPASKRMMNGGTVPGGMKARARFTYPTVSPSPASCPCPDGTAAS